MKSVQNSLLVVDENYLPVVLEILEHARESVDVLAFSFAIGNGAFRESSAPYKIAAKLAEISKQRKQKRKVAVRLYIEGHRETADRNQVTADFLKKAGVKIKYGSTHAKGICVDERFVLFGSTNLTNQSILKNNETNLFLDDAKIAEEFGRYFTHLWKGGKHGGIKLRPPLIADGGFKSEILDMMASAKSRLDFSIYFFHHSELERGLIHAHERGVAVRGFVHTHRSFALSYVRRTLATVKRLKAAGITDIHLGPDTLFTHSKYLIRDRKELALGTGNWLHEDIKVHPQLYIRLTNAPLCRQLASHLTWQIAGKSPGRRASN